MITLIIKMAALALFSGGVARADCAREVLKDSPVACRRFLASASTDEAAAKDETSRHTGLYHGNTIAHPRAAGGRPGKSPAALAQQRTDVPPAAQPLVLKA